MEKQNQLDPMLVFQMGLGVWISKVIFAATKLELFTVLGSTKLTGEELKKKLGLADRCTYDFFDSLVALGFLEREGVLENSVYQNNELSATFLDKNKESYIGGILELANDHYYLNWGKLEDALRTGQPQVDIQIHAETEANTELLAEYVSGMNGIELLTFREFAKGFDFSPYKNLCDIGGGNALLCTEVAKTHPHFKCYNFDKPALAPLAKEKIEKEGLTDRVEFVASDFFKESLPVADIQVLANVLMDWDLEQKKIIIRKAYEGLNPGGVLIIIENFIDGERRANPFGYLLSLTMLVSRKTGFGFTLRELTEWVLEAGFKKVEQYQGNISAAIVYK